MKYLKKIIYKNDINEISNKILKIRSKYHNSSNKINKALLLMKYKKLSNQCSTFLPIKAKIGKNLVLPHGLQGIFISQGSIIGDNCVIFHQVTIGSNSLEDSKKKGFSNNWKQLLYRCWS